MDTKKANVLKDHFLIITQSYKNGETEILSTSALTTGEIIEDLNGGSQNDFEVPRVKYKNKVVEPDMKGYFIYTSYLYRYFLEGITLYSVDSAIQFASGHSAIANEGYNSKFRAYESGISTSLTRNLQSAM